MSYPTLQTKYTLQNLRKHNYLNVIFFNHQKIISNFVIIAVFIKEDVQKLVSQPPMIPDPNFKVPEIPPPRTKRTSSVGWIYLRPNQTEQSNRFMYIIQVYMKMKMKDRAETYVYGAIPDDLDTWLAE